MLPGSENKVGGQKNKVGGQKNRVGGQKNKVGGQKNRVGGQKTGWWVKKTGRGSKKQGGGSKKQSAFFGASKQGAQTCERRGGRQPPTTSNWEGTSMTSQKILDGKTLCAWGFSSLPFLPPQKLQIQGRHRIHKHFHDTLTLLFCSWFKTFTLQSRVPNHMGLLEGIVVAAFAIGLALGSLLVKRLCRPCGFRGEDDRKVSKASNKLTPVPVQKDSCDDHYFGPAYLTASGGRYHLKPNCQMHKLDKFEICKHCLRNVKKKSHSEQIVYNLVAPKRPACYQRGGIVSFKMVRQFFTVSWTLW